MKKRRGLKCYEIISVCVAPYTIVTTIIPTHIMASHNMVFGYEWVSGSTLDMTQDLEQLLIVC